MALIYEAGYDYISKMGLKEIKFKQWTAKEERRYLSTIENDKVEFTDKTIYDILILPCIEDKKLVLSASEQKKLIMDIRIESISKYVEEEHECTKCKVKTNIKEEIHNFMKYIPSKFEDIVVENLKFVVGDIRTNKEKDILKLSDGIVNYVFNDFLLHIHSIEMDGILEENLKFKDVQKFTDSLPTKIFDELFDAYKDMVDDLILDYEFTCPECNEKETIDYTNMPNLLWA